MIPSSSAQVHIDRDAVRRSVDVEVLAERLGRIAFGLGFPIGALCLSALRLAGLVQADHAAEYLAAGWLCAVGGLVGVVLVARPFLRGGSGRTGDTLLRASLVIPTVALSLVLPLSLHLPFALVLGGREGFDGWAGASLMTVGHAHVVLAFLGAQRALRLVDDVPAMSPAKIYWIVVGVAAVPGVLAFGLPPLLVAVTGVVFRPFLGAIETLLVSERLRLAPD